MMVAASREIISAGQDIGYPLVSSLEAVFLMRLMWTMAYVGSGVGGDGGLKGACFLPTKAWATLK